MREEIFDVVSVGSGGGGLGAALAAADAGASVIVVEKSDQVGGTLAYSDGQVWCGVNHLAASAGMPDSPQDTTDYLAFLSRGVAEPALRDNFVTRAPQAIRFFCDQGIELTAIAGLADYYYPTAPGSAAEGRYLEIAPYDERRLGDLLDRVQLSPHGNGWMTSAESIAVAGDEAAAAGISAAHKERGERCTGQGLAAALVRACADRGVAFRSRTAATRLTFDDGRVTGVRVRDASGEQYIIRARNGVVLATGGYDYNPEFVRAFELVDELHSMAPSTTTGDALVMGGLVGAGIIKTRTPDASPFLLGFHTPGDVHEGRPLVRYYFPGYPHSIFVNRFGRRYSEDATYHHIMEAMAQVGNDGELINWPTWLVLDQNYRDKYTLGTVAPGQPLPDGLAAVTADTIGELAAAAGIDPAGLEESIARWNRFCELGEDRDFGRGTYAMTRAYTGPVTLGSIDKPPYVAIKLSRVSLNNPSAGLRINEDGQVTNAGAHPIPGLFAAGNAAATLDIGAVYQSGLGNSRGLTYGYLAAQRMATA